MKKQNAHRIIMEETNRALAVFRSLYPLPQNPDTDYFERQRKFINSVLEKTLSEEVKKAAI